MNRSELKSMAKLQIKGNIGKLFLVMLIAAGIPILALMVLANIYPKDSFEYQLFNTVISNVLIPPFEIGLLRVYLNLTGGTLPRAEDAFAGFDDMWGAIKVYFLTHFFTFLWTLLLIIPGIVKGISYSFAPYILAENKGKSALECIRESKALTRGHKWELFVLYLSFLGWIVLGALTLGIAYIWIIPYMEATLVNAYNKLKIPELRQL